MRDPREGSLKAFFHFPTHGIFIACFFNENADSSARETESGAIASLECVGSLGLAGSRPRVVSPSKKCHLASPSPVWSISNRQRTFSFL